MRATGETLIAEYEKQRWRVIAAYDFHGHWSPTASWWQVSDIHKISLGLKVPFRDYGADGVQ